MAIYGLSAAVEQADHVAEGGMMRDKRPRISALAMTLGALSSTPASATSGQAAIDALIGNSVVYESDGSEVYTYFDIDGTMKSLMRGKRDDTRWKAVGGKLCFQNDGGYGDCLSVTVYNENVKMENQGVNIEAKLIKGNPKNIK